MNGLKALMSSGNGINIQRCTAAHRECILDDAINGEYGAFAADDGRAQSGDVAQTGRAAYDLQGCTAGNVDRRGVGQIASIEGQYALIDVGCAGVGVIRLQDQFAGTGFGKTLRAAGFFAEHAADGEFFDRSYRSILSRYRKTRSGSRPDCWRWN